MCVVALSLPCLLPAAAAAGKTGSVTGKVLYEGKPAAPGRVTKPRPAGCAEAMSQHETVKVSRGGLAEAVVVLEGKGLPGKPPSEPVVITQDACMYQPRVSVAAQGQIVEVRNADPTLHNVHGYVDGATAFNLAQPPKARPIRREIAERGVLELKCDVHPWMHAWVYVAGSAFATVTKADGSFELEDVPPGEYTLEVWHPVLGDRKASVKVTAGKAAIVSIRWD